MAGTPKYFGRFQIALAALRKVPAKVAKGAATDIEAMMRRDFAAGRNAYGKAYAPLEPASLARGRRPPPLRKFAPLANAAAMAGAGIALSVDHSQAGFHQTGTQRMAKRIVVPDGALPAKWNAAIKRRLAAAVQSTMGGAR